jgi:hypothetical protein
VVYDCIEVRAEELQPGDLFSTAGSDYWNNAQGRDPKAIGERLYVRTEAPCPDDQRNEKVYRITVHPPERKT